MINLNIFKKDVATAKEKERAKFIKYEKEIIFEPPLFFMLLILILFRTNNYKELLTKKEELSNTKLKTWLLTRMYNYDYTLPLPRFLYVNFYYNGYSIDVEGNKVLKGKRQSNHHLIIFYETLRSMIECGMNEINVVRKLLDEPSISIFMRKELRRIQLELENGNSDFYDLLFFSGETFGKFESGLLKSIISSARVITALDDLLERLNDLDTFDRAFNTSMKSLKLNIFMAVASGYVCLIISVPPMIEAFSETERVGIFLVLLNYANFCKTPLGLLTHGVVIGIIIFLIKYFNSSVKFNKFKISMGSIGKMWIIRDTFRFMTTLYYQHKYINSNEYEKILQSCEVIENTYIKEFLLYKLRQLQEHSFNTVFMFKENTMFPSLVYYRLKLGSESASLLSNLEGINIWYKKENKRYLNEMPETLENTGLFITFVIIILFNAPVMLVELYMVTSMAAI